MIEGLFSAGNTVEYLSMVHIHPVYEREMHRLQFLIIINSINFGFEQKNVVRKQCDWREQVGHGP